MDAKKRTISIDEEIKILKLKVRAGTIIYDGRILLIYESIDGDTGNEPGPKQKKLKSPEVGVVKEILIKEGDVVPAGSVLIELEKACNHPTVIRDLCAECGADLQKENSKDGSAISQASVSMVHMVPELKVNDEVAQMLGKADINRLLEEKKLVLLVDLDQTLIHTTNDNIPNNINGVYHFQLYGPPSAWYHTRLRPGTHDFLQSISEKYELHICTFGSRKYAHMIARFLDPDGKYFSHRILSRDECFDPNSKTANLKALFPCGENMVCIIDDREDVWEYASNLIHVKPYHFFQHTGDIHAPPGLTKCENDDDKEGFDFSQFSDSLIADENSENNGTSNEDENAEEKQKYIEVDEVDEHEPNEKIVETNNETENVETCATKEKNVTDDANVMEEKKIDEDANQQITAEEMNEVSNNIEHEIVNNAPNDTKIIEKISNEIESEKIDESLDKQNEIAESTDTEDNIQENVSDVGETINVDETVDSADDQPKPNANVLPHSKIDAFGFVTIEESDDYLLYLEEILKIIHSEFYARFNETGEMPDLTHVIVETRARVLKGLSLVFSGIVPNHIRLEDSQAYKVARSLGAKVTQNIETDTTHLVALRAGTHKVHQAYKRKTLKLVTPDWLWTCAERWEKVDERLFPLKNAMLNIESRHPPAHCRSPEHPESLPYAFQATGTATMVSSKSNASQTIDFKETINPLMTFSTEDIQFMEGEVEDIFKESDGDTDDAFEEEESDRDHELDDMMNVEGENADSSEENENRKRSLKKRKYDNSSSSSLDEQPNCVGTRKKRIKKRRTGDSDLDCGESSATSDDETINTKLCRGEGQPSDLDLEYNTEDGTEDDRESDGEWNVMGAALEREFFENE